MGVEVAVERREAESSGFVSHHGTDLPSVGDRVQLGDEVGGGAFGTVHEVARLAGRPPRTALVAKLFDPVQLRSGGGPGVVVGALAGLYAALEGSSDRSWPDGVLALPYCVFTATVRGEKTIVALMLDLGARGYTAAPFQDQKALAAYHARPPQDRIDIAVRFTERFRLLEEIGFVHGDLNSENLLLNLDERDVQIIDFDSGVVVKTGSERPRTPGKPDMCMPPEVKGTGLGAQFDLAAFTPSAERWSLGSLIGYCLLGYHPGFFLRTISKAVATAYASGSKRWPDIDVHSPLFTDIPDNRRAYPVLRDRCLDLPFAVRRRFEQFFAAGVDGHARPSAAEWRDALTVLTNPPEIDRFEISEPTVFAGMTVELSWDVTGATEVEISGVGTRPPTGSVRVAVDASTAFTLCAENAYGEDTAWTSVRVLPVPRLDILPIPTTPSLTFRTEIPIVGLEGDRKSDWLPLLHEALSTAVDPGVDAVRPAPVPLALSLADSRVTLAPDAALNVYEAFSDARLGDVHALVDGIPPAPDPAALLAGAGGRT
jgi:hypothetical protein